jgi:hypothetical protein
MDSENLWIAAMNDFSFFGREESDITGDGDEPEGCFPMASLNEKVALDPEDDESTDSLPTSALNSPSDRTPSPHGRRLPLAPTPVAQRQLVPPQVPSGRSQSQGLLIPADEAEVDLASALAAFRRRKRAEYEEILREQGRRRFTNEASSLGPSPVSVEGHWKGEVQIVRNAAAK